MRDEEGVATVLGAVLMLIVVLAAVAVVHYALIVGARHRAQSAADVSAVAAAESLAWLHGEPCEVAREVAKLNRSEIRGCAVAGSDVVVRVSVGLPVVLPGYRDVSASARAGPAKVRAR
ncbi:Rv3654c family TadE-like protein [Hoyosella subflava]|uniref:Rv3654c family TadE-like protein n=1 Tax=Hoyosella subflava TaxID=639313 RepID=UPI00059CFC93|nr:Rv3654c family TadE-like protein [Hoyosella subflava]